MASRAMNYWRSMVGASRHLTTATTPKMKPVAAEAAEELAHHQASKWTAMRAEFMPIWVMFGMVSASVLIATHTAKQQLIHSPSVRISKKKRYTLAEVEDPDRCVGEANRFVNKSFLRKVAHLQDFDAVRSGIVDPTRPDDPFNHPRTVESLKSVGVETIGTR